MASVFLVIELHYYHNDISTSSGFKEASHSDYSSAQEGFVQLSTRLLVLLNFPFRPQRAALAFKREERKVKNTFQ